MAVGISDANQSLPEKGAGGRVLGKIQNERGIRSKSGSGGKRPVGRHGRGGKWHGRQENLLEIVVETTLNEPNGDEGVAARPLDRKQRH